MSQEEKEDQDDNKNDPSLHYCYICHDECKISSPLCGCNGTVAYAHEMCLIKWIKSSNKTQCQFCLEQYRIPFYSKIVVQLNKIYQVIVNSEILEYNLYTGIRWDDMID